MDGRSAERQRWLIGQDFADDEVGQIDCRRPHQDGEQAHQVNRQGRPAPGKTFLRWAVDHQVDVAVGRGDAIVHVRVEVADRIHIGRVNPERSGGRQRIVERGLAPLLPPWAHVRRVLYGQTPMVRDVLDHRIVPQFVRGLERGHDDAVDCAQGSEKDQDQQQDDATLPKVPNFREANTRLSTRSHPIASWRTPPSGGRSAPR